MRAELRSVCPLSRSGAPLASLLARVYVFPMVFRLILAGMCFWSSACTTWHCPPHDLVTQGVYRYRADTANGCTVTATIFAEEGKLQVHGKMTARHHPDGPVASEGEVRLVAPDGRVLSQKEITFVPVRHGRRSHPPAFFHLTFPDLPPVGTLIEIHHRLIPLDHTDATRGIR